MSREDTDEALTGAIDETDLDRLVMLAAGFAASGATSALGVAGEAVKALRYLKAASLNKRREVE